MATITTTAPVSTPSELRTVALSRIVVPDSFNPRGELGEDPTLLALADSMRQHGCLQPIRLRPDGNGDYVLIAGERRYRAAVLAALTELPAIVRAPGAGDEDEERELLEEAVLENELRSDLTPLARARAYQRLREQLTVRGIAERLCTTQARVREHLAILALPDTVQERVERGEVPLGAIKALTQLVKIHPGLADLGVRAVLQPADETDPYTWQQLIRDPLECALCDAETLPDGVYGAHDRHPLSAFTLSDKAAKDLAAYEKLTGQPLTEVRFGHELLEQARALGAVHGSNWHAVIVGQDVGDQLAGDYIARCVRTAREDRKRQQGVQAHNASDAAGTDPHAGEDTDENELAERQRAERQAIAERKDTAAAYNLDLGVVILKHLARLKVDERVLRILSAVDVGGTIKGLASRGARYGLPGWTQESTTRGGKAKITYLEPADAERHAISFLQGAEGLAELAGRQVVLITMATLADEDAIANSRRSFHHIAWNGPWSRQAQSDLDELVRERVPLGRLAALDALLQQRAAQRQAAAEAERARTEKAQLVEEQLQRIADLNDEQLAELVEQATGAYGPYEPRTNEAKRAVNAERTRRQEASAA